MDTLVLVGTRIKELREFRGFSQIELAKALSDKGISVSRETISKMETGNRNITALEIKALSDILDVETDFFFEEEEESLVALFRKKDALDENDELFLEDIFMTVEMLVAQEELHFQGRKQREISLRDEKY